MSDKELAAILVKAGKAVVDLTHAIGEAEKRMDEAGEQIRAFNNQAESARLERKT